MHARRVAPLSGVRRASHDGGVDPRHGSSPSAPAGRLLPRARSLSRHLSLVELRSAHQSASTSRGKLRGERCRDEQSEREEDDPMGVRTTDCCGGRRTTDGAGEGAAGGGGTSGSGETTSGGGRWVRPVWWGGGGRLGEEAGGGGRRSVGRGAVGTTIVGAVATAGDQWGAGGETPVGGARAG
ncbi:hypothetical protein Scep_015038 [Stephania cephalantha]|uniref:Uncharacterized protein n=1 Tax=Stephania cephalantha TaxID=152367 RepID=A0AAP0J260_9MAGN